MIDFLTYDLKVAAILAVFYMFYRLMLSHETFHRVNRVVLLATAVASFVLPLCVITLHKTVVVESAPSVSFGAFEAVADMSSETGMYPLWQSVAIALFFIGMVFCYFIIQPAAFDWLLAQSYDFANVIADAEDYLSIMMLLEIGFGIGFQLPLVIFYLSVLHVVPYKTFREQWRVIYVGLLVMVAMITPDGSPVTMLLMFAALVVLYEIALAIARQVIVARDGAAALRWDRSEYEEHAFED
jgi:Sec-independent protein secretion pathway component TatC